MSCSTSLFLKVSRMGHFQMLHIPLVEPINVNNMLHFGKITLLASTDKN